jgi:hypothetical protein
MPYFPGNMRLTIPASLSNLPSAVHIPQGFSQFFEGKHGEEESRS